MTFYRHFNTQFTQRPPNHGGLFSFPNLKKTTEHSYHIHKLDIHIFEDKSDGKGIRGYGHFA